MKTQLSDLLTPEVLHTVKGLELVARIVVEGFMSGSNPSQSVGSGQEFSQYRSYEPGDDLRQLDWKMYARIERYYIKQADIETNITVKFILDATESMSYTERGISKLQYAKILAAALAFLARKQSDGFGLFAINDKGIQTVLPRFEQQQYMRVLDALVALEAHGSWQKNDNPQAVFDHHGKELIIFFSDLFDLDDDLRRFTARLKTPRNEVIVFHLMGTDEMNLAYNGVYAFEELESGRRIRVDTVAQKELYVSRVREWIRQTRLWMLEKQINYHLVETGMSFEQVLRDFLKVRKSLMR